MHNWSFHVFFFGVHNILEFTYCGKLQLRSYRLTGLVMVVEEDKVSKFREELKSTVTD